MKILRKNKAKSFQNSQVCFGKEFPLGDKDINGALIEIRGRYPDKGRVVNLKCKELVYVLEGSGEIVVEEKKSKFRKGDMIFIMPKEKYYWKANCTILAICTPAFSPEQHKEVE